MACFNLQPIWAFFNPFRNYNPANIMLRLACLTHFPVTFTTPTNGAFFTCLTQQRAS